MTMNNLLQKDKPVYHRFIDNQVLTDDQLNAVLDHLNYQDKISRTKLIGVGIVCGLEISLDGEGVMVSGGTAVTTDGELIVIEETLFSGYKAFTDERVKYDHFLHNGDTIPLYELKEDTSATDVNPFANFEADTGILNNDIIGLVYVECYEKEPEDCSPLECNAQGKEVVKNIRVLLTSTSNANKIIAKDSILKGVLNGGLGSAIAGISKLYAKRIILNSGNTGSLSQLKLAFKTDFSELITSILKLSQVNLFSDSIPVNFNIAQKLNGIQQTNYNFFYIYDLYKDLVEACNELILCLQENFSICCPDPSAFPYHVMLGEVQKKPVVLRHAFYPSPTHDHENTLALLRQKYQRIIDMIDQFQVITNADIGLTPSLGESANLGDRALPVYYNINQPGSENKLLETWRANKQELILNYYKNSYPSIDFDPLDYCFRDHDFFRVEGHIGKDILAGLETVKTIRDSKGLGFDIMPIAIGSSADESTIDYDKFKVFFEDLQIILQAWNEEMKCIVAGSTQFLSGFSIAQAGQHLEYLDFIETAVEFDDSIDGDVLGPDDFNFAIAAEAGSGIDTGGGVSGSTNTFGGGFTNNIGVANFSNKYSNGAIENISQEENSTGSIWQNVIGISDNASDIQVKFYDILETQTSDWAEEIKYAAIEAPSKLLGALKASEDNKLLSIDNFTEANLLKYIGSLEKQCSTAKKEKKKLQSMFDKSGSALQNQPYMEQYFFVMNNIISTCCYIERFKVLYQEIINRKNELLDSLVLKNFILNHPSAEHKAGVPKGGTLILLYYAKPKPKVTSSGADSFTTNDVDAEAKPDFELPKLSDFDFNIFKASSGLSFELAGFNNIGDGTIVGDLYLPYICCSNTPAMSFVFPDQIIDLFIDKPFVCKEDKTDAELVLLTPTPSDATLIPTVDELELPNAIVLKDGKQFFDPNLVPEASYGKEISFTVNSQQVDASITIFIKPQASFKFGTVSFSNNNTKATVVIQNTSVPIDGQSFLWDFDGESLDQDATIFDQDFKVVPGETYKFNVTLTAQNGSCFDSFPLELEFEVPKDEILEENLCKAEVESNIDSSLRALGNMVKLYEAKLGILPAFFETDMSPLYDLILKDLDVTLSGSIDTPICDEMKIIIGNIKARLDQFPGVEGQAFLICMHYEVIQLYFFIQRCRTKNITSKQGITSDLLKATQTYVASFENAVVILMQDKTLVDNLIEIVDSMGDRMSATLSKAITDSADILKSVNG